MATVTAATRKPKPTYPRPGQGRVRDESTDRRIASKGRSIRWVTEGPELQCPWCREFWPLTSEFWMSSRLYKCLACRREETRARMAALRSDPATLMEHAARLRAERRARRHTNHLHEKNGGNGGDISGPREVAA